MEQVAIAARESSLRGQMELKRRMQEVREKLKIYRSNESKQSFVMKEKRPTLCIVAGPNGSGKTSTTEQL